MSNNRIDGGVVIFKFRGGPRDQDHVRSDLKTESDSTNEATLLWAMTKGGKVGKPAKVSAGGTIADLIGGGIGGEGSGKLASKKHLYKVVDRQDTESEITVTVEFVKSID